MKKLWDLKKGFSNLELEGQQHGIIMGVTGLLLLGQFFTIQTQTDQTFWRGVYEFSKDKSKPTIPQSIFKIKFASEWRVTSYNIIFTTVIFTNVIITKLIFTKVIFTNMIFTNVIFTKMICNNVIFQYDLP